VEATEEVTEAPGLPSTPIPQSIQTADGETLEGTFYPAANAGAPLVILMHWAMGDQTDWRAIGPWLQNRGEGQEIYDGPANWLDASWFPSMPEGETMNALAFTFRGCQGGCQNFDREGWLLDVEAVMNHVSLLEGVDPDRIMTLGASIGADGAAYGCHYYNEQQGGGCRGALSLSPGGYLTIPYPEEVESLENRTPPTPAWCLYSTGDGPSAAACRAAEGSLYQAVEYEGSDHGMALVIPDRDPNPLDLILDFIAKYLKN
jgi:dienelactone hydrolase